MFSASTSTSRKSTLILTVLTLLSTLLTHAEANNSTHVNVGPHRRHHHNKLARRNIPAEPLHDQSPVKRGIIASGSGHGTFYYDVSGGGGKSPFRISHCRAASALRPFADHDNRYLWSHQWCLQVRRDRRIRNVRAMDKYAITETARVEQGGRNVSGIFRK